MAGIDPATAAVIKDKAEALFAKGRVQEAAAAYEAIAKGSGVDALLAAMREAARRLPRRGLLRRHVHR